MRWQPPTAVCSGVVVIIVVSYKMYVLKKKKTYGGLPWVEVKVVVCFVMEVFCSKIVNIKNNRFKKTNLSCRRARDSPFPRSSNLSCHAHCSVGGGDRGDGDGKAVANGRRL